MLASCLCVRNAETGHEDCQICESVLEAVETAIDKLAGREDLTAVVILGEEVSRDALNSTLFKQASALARVVAQPGLFVTLAAQDIVRDRLMSDVRFENFGIFGAGELDRAERLFAVFNPDLFEPILPQKRVVGNIPKLQRSFIGRHVEVDELQNTILDRSLVTIIGPPGVGKSTTANHVARSIDEEFEDGVWWFSVEDKASLDDLLLAMSGTKGLLKLKGVLTPERIAEALSGKTCLIVFDGCEGMPQEVSRLCGALLSKAPGISVLLTSPRPLAIEKEYVYRLNPMSLPDKGETGEDALISSEALALFFERAAQAGERLPLDEDTVSRVGEVCEKVDGLPVAIELIAASLRTHSLERLIADLEGSLGEIFRRSHGLDHALRISYEAIDPEHRELLSRLIFFRGEWRPAIVKELWPDLDSADISRLHAELAESSWLSFSSDKDTYRMLQTVRSFIKSVDKDQQENESRFCGALAAYAKTVTIELQTSISTDREAVLARHYSDLIFALQSCLKRRAKAPASELMFTLVHHWLRNNILDDAEKLSTAFLDSGVIGLDEARGQVMLGVVNVRRRKTTEAKRFLEKCLAIGVEENNFIVQFSALHNLGMAFSEKGDLDAARAYLNKGLEIVRLNHNDELLCAILCNLADVEFRAVEAHRIHLEKAPVRDETLALDQAQRYIDEAQTLIEKVSPIRIQAFHTSKGALALCKMDLTAAEASFNKAILICARHGIHHEATEAIEGLIEINLFREKAPTAAKLMGLSRRIRTVNGDHRTDLETMRYGVLAKKLYSQIPQDRADKLMSYGDRLDLAEILIPTIFDA